MKVLVAGAGGQVGEALVRTAPVNVELSAFRHRELDISDAASVDKCIERHAPNVIINAAAYTAVDRAETECDLARRINTHGPSSLAIAARAGGIRLIHISTNFVFDGTACEPYRPGSDTNPLAVYGLTKRDGDLAVMNELPDRSVVLRTAWVYSPGRRNFVDTMLNAMRVSRSVRVVADQVGTPTSARSLAQAIWKLVDRPDIHGLHHWTDAGVASWYDFAVAIAEEATARGLLPEGVTVTPITSEQYSTPARRPRYGVLDTTSLTSLGIVPSHWRTELRRSLEGIPHG